MYPLERHVLYPETHIDVRYFSHCFLWSESSILLSYLLRNIHIFGVLSVCTVQCCRLEQSFHYLHYQNENAHNQQWYIYNLIIQTTPWTVGRKFGMSGKTVSTTATDNQRTTFVFEIHMWVVQITGVQMHRTAPLFVLFIIVSFSAYFV